MTYDFKQQQQAWKRIPIDDVGYFDAEELLARTDEELHDVIEKMEVVRYTGWRNHKNQWRETLGLDTTTHQVILDFGCGCGIESLQFARNDNDIILCDINQATLDLAVRVLEVFDVEEQIVDTVLAQDTSPFMPDAPIEIDIFYANGSLHHLPYDVELLTEVHDRHLVSGGEVRLMVYSDRGWEIATDTPPPEGRAMDDPRAEDFVRWFDEVGAYADCYSLERCEERFGDLFEVTDFHYITTNDEYATVTLRKPR